mgnify:CR=1 FL=1
MSDIFDVLRVAEEKPYRPRDVEESATNSNAMTATEANYPPASSSQLALQAQELRRNAVEQSRRTQNRLKQNEDERRELTIELEQISDLIARLEERKSLVGSAKQA